MLWILVQGPRSHKRAMAGIGAVSAWVGCVSAQITQKGSACVSTSTLPDHFYLNPASLLVLTQLKQRSSAASRTLEKGTRSTQLNWEQGSTLNRHRSFSSCSPMGAMKNFLYTFQRGMWNWCDLVLMFNTFTFSRNLGGFLQVQISRRGSIWIQVHVNHLGPGFSVQYRYIPWISYCTNRILMLNTHNSSLAEEHLTWAHLVGILKYFCLWATIFKVVTSTKKRV